MARLSIPRPAPRIIENVELPFVLPHSRYDVEQLDVIIGKKGQGKTTGQEHYIETREPRLLVVTPRPDFQRVELADDLDDALNDLSFGEPCRRRVVVNRRTCGGFETMHEYGQYLFGRCCDELRNALLVLSEVHLLAAPAPNPPSPELVDLISQGRHYGVRMMVDSQHPRFLQSIFFLEMTHLVAFKVTDEKDLDVVESYAGAETAQTVAQLDKGKCAVVTL